ncbi:rhomboid family intramembrane serine protease [Chloroflexota bacterium]
MYRGYRGYSSTPIWFLIGINVLVFIVTMVRSEFIFLLGLQPATFLQQPWTIVTNLFVHGGFGHILTNMITLFFFGSFLCRLLGERKFLLVYFAGGIVGNIFYLWLANPFTIAIGASGAVFAIGGALTVLTPKLRVFIFPIPAPIPLWAAVIGGFLIISLFPNIAWQAHLGGLLLGLAAGYYFRKQRYIRY